MKLICMAFDGDYKTESPIFEDKDGAWRYSDDLGSKWYFYPFHFVTSDSGKTIVDAPHPFEPLIGKRVATVARRFEQYAKQPESEGMDVERFAYSVPL